ncbi:MAG: hypothetical protein WC637_05995 [Victivallales bacterium]|jgi:hypothetical protein
MKHPIFTDLEKYNRKEMGIFSRILTGIHLKKCRKCSTLLEKLREDDRLLMDLRAAMTRQSDEEITEFDKTFVSLKKILR